jgi:hypothetical protein
MGMKMRQEKKRIAQLVFRQTSFTGFHYGETLKEKQISPTLI